ncbi:chemotaxis protein CheW [Variovorax ginsengisoli]|uniref:Chemotaxis protein CheW n=1 Tax=Variovorax ginsengisoli TaxID=363844 RepID=A0ABT9SEF5_9BURK|nr:chemotaxis protein CheW [Variovorax ginsengisoli]MDP9902163.1 chemotaxis signal transduction protein [Variovorax ginsengisoli]
MDNRQAPGADAQAAPLDDCWNRIGSQGNKQCERLAEHIHCRNCPVFARAARAVIDRLVPQAIDAPAIVEAPALLHMAAYSMALLVFRVQGEWLGLPTRVLDHVSPVRPVHTLPHHWDPTVLGVTNVRGTLTVCISLARMLGIDAGPPTPATADAHARPGEPRMLVMGGPGRAVVLPVDEVDGIYRVAESDVDALPATLAQSSVRCARGVVRCGPHVVGVLDEVALTRSLDRSLT